jgi:hypothetical protein
MLGLVSRFLKYLLLRRPVRTPGVPIFPQKKRRAPQNPTFLKRDYRKVALLRPRNLAQRSSVRYCFSATITLLTFSPRSFLPV